MIKVLSLQRPFFPALVLGLAIAAFVPSARANVYATNIKLNGGMANVTLASATNVGISYILNEPATAGVTLRILSGNSPVRTLTLTNGAPGTGRGFNSSVVWDGNDDNGQPVPTGTYAVSITAASQGYSAWTLITDDDAPGNYTWQSRGIAVDRNTNSPYYGRVFVGNAYDNSQNSHLPGDYVGIQKLNADASFADEGAFSDGGVAWRGNYLAPWKIRVSADDNVYVGDATDAGDIYRFDPTISSNSMLHVFAPPTDRSQGWWTGFWLTGQGTNTLLWGADGNYPGSLGIEKFAVKPDGTFGLTNGNQVVAVGGSPGLNVAPYTVAVDGGGSLYTLQNRTSQGDPSAWVLRFPAYNPATNSNSAETVADWVAGPGDDYCGGQGIAVDPTGTYVAAGFWGYLSGFYTSGNIKVLNATNGLLVTNIDLGIAFTNSLTTDWTTHLDTDCDWDAVGNLYYLDDEPGCWRAFSPPGPNQATTRALPLIQVGVPTSPSITSISVSGSSVTIHFTGASSDPASAFTLLSAASARGAFGTATNAVVTGSNGTYQASVAVNGPAQFYRLRR